MEYEFSKQACKFLGKLNQTDYNRLIKSIYKLPKGDVIKLQGTGGYRLRVGDFRVLFDKDGKIICITSIDNRGQVYK